jgi:hypothetical protein
LPVISLASYDVTIIRSFVPLCGLVSYYYIACTTDQALSGFHNLIR